MKSHLLLLFDLFTRIKTCKHQVRWVDEKRDTYGEGKEREKGER